MTQVDVSVVIPARDAAETLGAALDSLQAQTHEAWEAIVVDDGSTDDTAALVEERAARDRRLRLVRRSAAGVSAARNAGIAEASAPWLAFLDADDWLAPHALERLLAELRARPHLDAVHAGWTRIAPDGREVDEICPRTEEDMSSWHAHNCAFAIHAVLVRRELVERAGGFDPELATCEDWDLWLKLSQLGARWGRVDAQLACYRMREASASMASLRLLRDGLVVIDRAGEQRALRARARLGHAVYSAALALGQGHDAVPMLEVVAGDRCEDLPPDQVAYALFEGVPLGAATIPSDWPSFPPELVARVSALLDEIERIAGAPELATRARRMLERLVAETGATHALFSKIETVALDLERPLSDQRVADETERLLLHPSYGELELSRVELPACDGSVPAELIADAVADEHAWRLLGEFFGADRDDHDRDGWLRLLQGVCGDSSTPNAAFYDASHDDELEPAGQVEPRDGWVEVELAAPLPELAARTPVRVVATLGGATLAALEVEPSGGAVKAGALRRAICSRAGFELCRLAVREGVLGHPRDDGRSLREHLVEAAGARRATSIVDVVPPPPVALAPGWERHAARALNGFSSAYVIARRRGASTGLSGSRTALIPRRAAADAVAGARAAGDPVLTVGAPGPDAPAVYAPDIVWAGDPHEPRPAPFEPPPAGPGRAFFEALFARGEDPWGYTSEYERGKYVQTLSLLPAQPPRRALELACAEGHFTRQLAARVDRLVACDVSEIALRRARRRCADLEHVSFRYHDMFAEPIEGRYDLVVCSEVLYYAGDRGRLDHTARAIAGVLEPEGTLLAAHANLVVDDPRRPGFDWDLPFGARTIARAFDAAGLDLVEELSNPLYRVQAYRPRRRRARLRRPRPVRGEALLPPELPRQVEERFLWNGGEPAANGDGEPVTWELPILMYHRVAPTGTDRLREWRVTPEELEAQLHYLHAAGYRSASLEEWRDAAERHQPLPGRRVMLTFDDGYEDFAAHAHPLLRRYGFEATVFLVTEHVGGTNAWDGGYGESVPLMGWDTIRALDGDGVSFGGHTASHPMMTALGLDEVVREATRCRATLVRELGHVARAFAYPYGEMDAAIARMVGACGFEFAVTTAGYAASATTPMLSLPRINVAGTDSFETFVRRLASGSEAAA